ncbi:MAG TPA: hypothetical protein PLI00_05265 [Pseudomonadota bacterium]|nr:hypothetical protein [Pseudomonadota bacterium]
MAWRYPLDRTWRRCTGAVLACALLAPAAPAAAAILIDLSGVDTGSAAMARFRAYVDSAVAGARPYAFSATDAAYAWRLVGNPAYCQLAVALAEEQVAAAEREIAAGQRAPVASDSYLEVGDFIRDLSITYDWCASFTTASQRTRWAAYAEQAVWNVWNPAQARWGTGSFPWSGWSINDPGNNYHFSFLEATMYWSLASNSSTWRTFLDNQKFPPLMDFFAALPGGGSREGTGYGLAQQRLFELYRMWRDSTGTNLGAAGTHLNDSPDYWIHATVPTLDRIAPIGDQSRSSYPSLYDYHRNVVLQARLMGTDAAAAARAQWWLGSISIPQMTSSFNYRHDLLAPAAGGTAPTALYRHATGTGHLFARSNWTRDALWMGFVAGRYDQSHAHQDQGAFTLFQRDFLAVTENIFTHSGIQQGAEVHNVVRFTSNGTTVRQREGTTSTMVVTPGANGALTVDADLTPSYNGNAAVGQWRRRLDFNASRLRVHDTFTIGAGVQATFQVNTPVQPFVNGRTATAGSLLVTVIEPADATLSVLDWRTVEAGEYDSGYRLDIRGSGNAFVVELACASSSCTPRPWPRPLVPRPRPPR